jgi:hypothetical protein
VYAIQNRADALNIPSNAVYDWPQYQEAPPAVPPTPPVQPPVVTPPVPPVVIPTPPVVEIPVSPLPEPIKPEPEVKPEPEPEPIKPEDKPKEPIVNVSLPTKPQWISIAKNTLFAVISAIAAVYANDPTLGVVAMFILKFAEKVLVAPKEQ